MVIPVIMLSKVVS